MKLNQIFEFSMALDNGKFHKILSGAYNIEKYEEGYIDSSMAFNGITVVYINSQYKKKIKVVADSRLLLRSNKIDPDEFISNLDKRINGYFRFRYKLDDFKLSRVVFTMDINVHNHDNVASYIRVLQRIGRVKGFSPSYYDCFEENASFCLDGNSNGIQFLIYDLEDLLKNQIGKADISRKRIKSITTETQGILRAEVRLTKAKTIRNYTKETDVLGQIDELLKHCQDVFMDTFARVIPFGDYYKKDEAVEIIHRDVKDSIMRRKMLRLLTFIPEKKSLYLAQKAMICRDMEKIMKAFSEINLSPVTISKRHDVNHLESLYVYML